MASSVLSILTVTYTIFILTTTYFLRSGVSFTVFSNHGFSTTWTGFIESSMIFGNIGCFVLGIGPRMLARCSTRQGWTGLCIVVIVTALINGFLFHIPNRAVLLVVAVTSRAVQGALSFLGTMLYVDTVKLVAPEKFEVLLGVVGAGQMMGITMSVTIGDVLVDHIGYTYAYLVVILFVVIALGLCFTLLPSGPSFSSSRPTILETDQSVAEDRLSIFIVLPLLACVLENFCFGYVQIATTTYLHEDFDLSFSYAGAVVSLMGPANCLGSVLSGLFLQLNILRADTQMILGVAILAVALFLLFAPTWAMGLHAAVPFTAFPAVFMVGFAETFVTFAALQVMYSMQEKKHGTLSPRHVLQIAAIWISGYATFFYASSLAAGALMDVLPYQELGMLLIVLCVVSAGTSGICRWVLNRADREDSDTDSESELLIKRRDDNGFIVQ